MSIEIRVPVLPESVVDAVVAKWQKKIGEPCDMDDNLLDLETDKVMLEVPAPVDGVITEYKVNAGDVVKSGQVIAIMQEGAAATPVSVAKATSAPEVKPELAKAAAPVASPSVRRTALESDINLNNITGSGKGGRILKTDLQPGSQGRAERRVPMSRLRMRIAERLLEVKQQTAMLTTFNEVNMQPVMDLRKKYKDQFEKQHGVRLGFMSFFVKAAVEALKRFPSVNAYIDGDEVVYHDYFDVGIAVGTDRGLVVPILRDASFLSMADVEAKIREYAGLAQAGKLSLEDMQGGTFTITNGGVYGSMLSTPILNPPQSAILGMHNIVERAVVENGQIVIRPMMYLALSYDHRIIDGKESVSFLVAIKEMLEDPARLLLEV
jgi:2-oxoglutarate dehydrogenase E2 component (dihydrolipoamide succinyltransferase)